MAAPLFLMALLWDRFDLGRRRWLRGREITLGGLRLHTTNLVSGLMFITIGVLFVVFEGTSALEGFYDARGATDLAFAVEWWVNGVAESVPLSLALAAAAVMLAGLLLYRRARRGDHGPGGDSGNDPAGHEG
jgi:hypothetical protein